MIRITDEVTGRTETVPEASFADTVEHWYPGCPADVIAVFDKIERLVIDHQVLRFARQLGLVVDYL